MAPNEPLGAFVIERWLVAALAAAAAFLVTATASTVWYFAGFVTSSDHNALEDQVALLRT